MRRSFAIAALVVLVVATASTSAAANTVPAGQWAPKFCGALSTFQQRLSSDGTQADAVLSGNITSMTQAKTTLATFMARAVKDTDTAIAALKHAGTPSAANGSKIAAQFMSGFENARTLFALARTKAQRLPTKTLAGFEGATKKVTGDLNKGAEGLNAKFGNIQTLDTSGKIAAALRAEPTCAFLQNSSQQSPSQSATTSTVP
jgi:hypothetical protein